MPLYEYQRDAVRKALRLGGKSGVFLEMGTGKTRVALSTARTLHDVRILVVAPLSAVGVWEEECAVFWHSLAFVDCTRGSNVRRAERMRALNGDNPHLVIVGYESYWRGELRTAILKWAPDLVVYDEAHRIKERRSKQSRFAHVLTRTIPHRLALTGTPMPNGLQDAFSIFKAIDPDVFGTRWVDFELSYIIKGGYMGYQITGYRNQDRAERLIRKHSSRVTKAEALDLPPQVDVVVPVKLGDEARRIYDRLRTQAISQVQGRIDGTDAQGVALSRVVITNILRLQQVTSGYVKVVDGRIIEFDTAKVDVLRDLLQDVILSTDHVVVFGRFTHDIDAIQNVAEKFGPTYVYDGRVSNVARRKRLTAWKQDGGILVGQVQVSSLAIDLTASHIGIFFSPDYSLTNYLQSRDRLHRHGQKEKVTYYHLVAEESIDRRIYAALASKEDVMRRLLDRAGAVDIFAETSIEK